MTNSVVKFGHVGAAYPQWSIGLFLKICRSKFSVWNHESLRVSNLRTIDDGSRVKCREQYKFNAFPFKVQTVTQQDILR